MNNLLLILLGLLLLSNLGDWLGIKTAERHPRLSQSFLKLGESTFTFAVGLLGLVLVVFTLRTLGWISPTRG